MLLPFLDSGRGALGLGPAPFGWPSVLAVHLAAAAPLSWVTASRVAKLRKTRTATFWTLTVMIAAVSGPFVASAIESVGAGPRPRAAIRTGLAFLLELPWSVLLSWRLSVIGRTGGHRRSTPLPLGEYARRAGGGGSGLRTSGANGARSHSPDPDNRIAAHPSLLAMSHADPLPASGHPPPGGEGMGGHATSTPSGPYYYKSLIITALLAFLPPVAYSHHLLAKNFAELESHLSAGRLLEARPVLEGLREVGGRRINGLAPERASSELASAIRRLEVRAREPLRPEAGPNECVRRAYLLIQLDRMEEAELLLLPLVDSTPDAPLLLGAAYRARHRWPEARRAYGHVLATIPSGGVRSRDAIERCAMAFDGLAEVARASGHPEEAERAYRAAIRRLPSRGAYFASQLGRHYQGGGRPTAALEAFAEALRLDPSLESRLRPFILQTRHNTPSCLLAR